VVDSCCFSILVGDVILEFAGVPVHTMKDVTTALGYVNNIGQKMCMKIYRHGSSKNPQIFCFVPNEARPT
jgi:S1-C subfamily serine protease